MICPVCSSSKSYELTELYSAWGLHKLKLADPQARVSVCCRSCGFAVHSINGAENISAAVVQARKRFSEGYIRNYEENLISWEQACKMVPAIREHYERIIRR